MPDRLVPLRFCLAVASDVPRLTALIEASVRGLQANDYSPSQIEQALGTWLGLDTQLIADGTYLAVEPSPTPPSRRLRWLVAPQDTLRKR